MSTVCWYRPVTSFAVLGNKMPGVEGGVARSYSCGGFLVRTKEATGDMEEPGKVVDLEDERGQVFRVVAEGGSQR